MSKVIGNRHEGEGRDIVIEQLKKTLKSEKEKLAETSERCKLLKDRNVSLREQLDRIDKFLSIFTRIY